MDDSTYRSGVVSFMAVCILGFLFLGTAERLPCGEGSSTAPGNVTLLDWQPDGGIDLSDGIGILQFLFG